MRPKKKVGLKDIAKRAGVSVVTVSNALAGREGVSQDKRKEIFQIAEELGYPVSETKEKKNRGNYRFAVCTYDESWREILKCAAKRRGILLDNLETAKDCAGCIFAGEGSREEFRKFLAVHREPAAGIGFFERELSADFIMDDAFHGTGLAVRILLEQGFQNIAAAADIRKRETAGGRALDGIFGVYHELFRGKWGSFEPDFCRMVQEADYRRFLGKSDLPEGIVCLDKEAARALHQDFKRRGIRIPDGVKMISYGGRQERPELPAVIYEEEEMADCCLMTLVRRLEQKEAPEGVQFIQGRYLE